MVQVGNGQHLGRVLQAESEHLAVEPLAVGVIGRQVVDAVLAFAKSRDQHPAGPLQGTSRNLKAGVGVLAEAGRQQRGLLAGGQVRHEQVVRLAEHVEAHIHVLPLSVAGHVAVLHVGLLEKLQAVAGNLCTVWGREVTLVCEDPVGMRELHHAVAAAGAGGDVFRCTGRQTLRADDLSGLKIPGEQAEGVPVAALISFGHEAPGAAVIRRRAAAGAGMGGRGPVMVDLRAHVGQKLGLVRAVR